MSGPTPKTGPPPSPSPTPGPIYARTPPSLFPTCLGLVGLALAWRKAAAVLGTPALIGEALAGMATATLAVSVLLYAAKLARRPGAVVDDLRQPAGRGAVSAGSMAMLVAAALLAPFAPTAAAAVWSAGLALHLLAAALLIEVLWSTPAGARPIGPALYVPFVGAIAAPLAGVRLGHETLSALVFVATMLIYIPLTGAALARLARGWPPPAMRPQLAIFLSPTAIGVVAHAALPAAAATAFLSDALYAISAIVAVALLASARWLTGGGWSPVWGAFTFPAAAFAGASLVLAERRSGLVWDLAAAGALAAATAIVLGVAWMMLRDARAGRLFRPPVV